MRVLVADKFEKSGLDGLKTAGCEVLYQPDLKDDALTAAIGESAADVLVVPSSAVQTSQTGQHVFVVKADKTAELRDVVVERTFENDAVVSKGLSEGETVDTVCSKSHTSSPR